MRPVFAAALLLLAAPAGASTITIDFEAEPGGTYEPFYAHSGGFVTFAGIKGVQVGDFGAQGDGRALAAYDDDSGHGLTIAFSGPVSSLSLAFGNDDPMALTTSDEAVLEAFLGAVKIGEARVTVNANDVLDQVIELAGVGPFDRAVLTYTGDVDEVIDNLSFEPVPEPGTLGLLAFCAAAYSRLRCRG